MDEDKIYINNGDELEGRRILDKKEVARKRNQKKNLKLFIIFITLLVIFSILVYFKHLLS